MMRIAFVAADLPLGGSATFTLFLAAALRRMNVPVEVFSFASGDALAGEFAQADVKVYREEETRLIYEERLQRLYVKLRAFRPTAVFAVIGAESFEMLRYLPAGVGRIGIVHDRSGQLPITLQRYSATLDHLVVVASYLREDTRALDPQFPCTYLAHGIPIPSDTLPRFSSEPADPLRLLYYGRLENGSKGVRMFPEIAAALKRRGVPFNWTIHGYGPEEAYLKSALADNVRTGQVRFSSPLPYEQLPGLIRQHDVYLLASAIEGGPLTLLESMSLGLVPVCGDIPGLVQDLITPALGFRVPRTEAGAYAKSIATLHSDRNLLEQMSRACRAAIVADFSADAMARRYAAFLEALNFSASNVFWTESVQVRPILGSGQLLQSKTLRNVRRIVKRIRRQVLHDRFLSTRHKAL
jgi:glycosyltransferase involved in cell wall biosynthesis